MKTLRQVIDEALDPATAGKMAPILKKYADRATQDKSPDGQILNQLVTELINMSKAPAQNTQNTQQQPATTSAPAVQGQ